LAEVAVRSTPGTGSARRIVLSGYVQGVGFRPFVYRLAQRHGLTGQVQNRLGQVVIVAAGADDQLARFEAELVSAAPPLARPHIDESCQIEAPPAAVFSIAESSADAAARVFVPPDYFMCEDCRRELHDPADRRFRYPFINCTQCGPRYTLIEALPYDRSNTSMAGFALCDDCLREYRDPGDRRFHAEPVACPACGPQLRYASGIGEPRASAADALAATLKRLNCGGIVAIKGIGGYHLMCDARDEAAVAALRQRKHRPDKPLAVMFPIAGQDGLDAVRRYAEPARIEAELLLSPARPIVLVNKSPHRALARNVAPGLREIGVFLPYSPLHQLLLESFGAPLVATSANISGEPVLTDGDEVERRLGKVADAFLHHDRRIVRPADDPVYRRIANRMRPLRIGRGCAPLELTLPWRQREPLLAVGGHMKGTLALSFDDRVVVSPHIGEMDSPRSIAVFEQVAADLQALYNVTAERIVCDAHPGYTTHRWAREQGLPVETVWHHRAHASALAAEFEQDDDWLVFAWDGVGYGEDGTLWGGEAFLGRAGLWRRAASFRPFRLPGGERAGREPWRSAAALFWTAGHAWHESPDRQGLAEKAWHERLNCPETSAVGRLFDAAAALVCHCHVTSFEAQGPMLLEALVTGPGDALRLPLTRDEDGVWRSNWEPLLYQLADGTRSARVRAEAFHTSMARALLDQALRLRDESGAECVGLTGGVFQNRALAEQARALLEADGFRVFLPRALPCNDAGLAFGQAAEFAARRSREE
jgi:hydrogenase maturation protein HypF